MTERKNHAQQGPVVVSDCIDLTAYEDDCVKDEREGVSLISTISELKIDERSSSNCENEAALAVNNIKTLLDLGDNDEMTVVAPVTIPMDRNHENHHRITNGTRGYHEKRNRDTPHHSPQSTPEAGNHQNGPIRLWTVEEPPRPEQYHQQSPPKSEYHMAKERLMSARRQSHSRHHHNNNDNNNNKQNHDHQHHHHSSLQETSDAHEIRHLTQKHDELVRIMSEGFHQRNHDKNGGLIEVIHLEHDQIVAPLPSSTNANMNTGPVPPTTTSNTPSSSSSPHNNSSPNRLFIDTSEMDDTTPRSRTKYDGSDLVTAFGYEFDKRRDENDEPSDEIIVIDDEPDRMTSLSSIDPTTTKAGQNVAARYEAIRHSVAGRISHMERTKIHPLVASPVMSTEPEMKPDPTTTSTTATPPRALSPSHFHFIRDQVKSLQGQSAFTTNDDKHAESSGDDVDETKAESTIDLPAARPTSPEVVVVRSPSRASAIEGLIAAEPTLLLSSKSDPMTTLIDDESEDHPLSAEAEYRKRRNQPSTLTNPSSPMNALMNQEVKGKVESDFIAITRNISSKTFATDALTESSAVGANAAESPKNESTNTVAGEVATDAPSTATLVKKESPVLITAAELCVGFCANNGDTISLPDDGGKEMTFERNDPMVTTLSPINSVGSTVEHTPNTTCNDADGLEPPNEPALKDIQATVNLAKSKSKEGRRSGNVNDLALSEDESSESYPSDVDVNDDDAGLKYPNKSKYITANDTALVVKFSNTVDTNVPSSKSVISTATESHVKRNTEASLSDNASFVSDNSGTRESLGDSDNSDSDEDTGIYDSCFARQIFDDTCAWLERDESSFCFRPSLLKKVKRRNVGPIKKYYGRSPLVLRVPRNPIITRNYLQSRRKVPENSVRQSRRNGSVGITDGNVPQSEAQSTLLKFRKKEARQNMDIDKESTKNGIETEKAEAVTKKQPDIEVLAAQRTANVSRATDTTHKKSTGVQPKDYKLAELSGVFEADSKNLAIFEVKSAEEYTSHHFSNFQQSLRSRSMSPISFSIKQKELEVDASKQPLGGTLSTNKSDHNDVKEVVCAKLERSRDREDVASPKPTHHEQRLKLEPIDCTGTMAKSENSSGQWVESPDASAIDELTDPESSIRPKSRREGLAKLRIKSPVRHELIQLEHVESEIESTDNSTLNEEQRLAALEMAEKLRRRAMTLRRRRKLRERRREVRCMDSQMVVS